MADPSFHGCREQPSDSIVIPEYQPSVKVSGAVNSPGSVLWQQGKDLEYYLGAAGGVSYRAGKGRGGVGEANGGDRRRRRSVFVAGDPQARPGAGGVLPLRGTTPTTELGAFVHARAG